MQRLESGPDAMNARPRYGFWRKQNRNWLKGQCHSIPPASKAQSFIGSRSFAPKSCPLDQRGARIQRRDFFLPDLICRARFGIQWPASTFFFQRESAIREKSPGVGGRAFE